MYLDEDRSHPRDSDGMQKGIDAWKALATSYKAGDPFFDVVTFLQSVSQA